MAFNDRDDHLFWVGKMTAQVRSKVSGADENVEVAVLREDDAQTEAATSYAVYRRHVGTIYIPSRYMVRDIEVGDSIYIKNNWWVVQNVSTPRHSGQFVCVVDSLSFNIPLTDKVNWYTSIPSTDQFGSRILVPKLKEADIICAIQPISAENQEYVTRNSRFERFLVYLTIEGNFKSADTLHDGQRTYNIINVENKNRIDEFVRLTVESPPLQLAKGQVGITRPST